MSGGGINKVKGRTSSSVVCPKRTPGGKHATAPKNSHMSTSAALNICSVVHR